MRFYKSKGGYFYKEYKNGKKVRISKDKYDKLKSTTKKYKNKPNTKAKPDTKIKKYKTRKRNTKIMKGGNFTRYFLDRNIEKIGQGSFGSVYKYKLNSDTSILSEFFSRFPIAKTELENKDEQEVAVKFLYFPEGTSNEVMGMESQKEVNSGNIFLGHPFFIKMYGILELNEGEYRFRKVERRNGTKNYLCKCCILMEYFRGDNLLSCMAKHVRLKDYDINLSFKCVIIYQLLLAVQHMAKNDIMHRDLKPENILINMDTLEIKIIDYGFATKDPYKRTYAGSPKYVCPQIIKTATDENIFYNKRVDVWSLGVIIFEILTNKHLFTSRKLKGKNFKYDNVLKRINDRTLIASNNEISQLIPQQLKDLLKDMLIPFFNNARYPRPKHPMHIDNICDPERPWIKYLDRMIIERYDKVGVVGHLEGLAEYLKAEAQPVKAADAAAHAAENVNRSEQYTAGLSEVKAPAVEAPMVEAPPITTSLAKQVATANNN